MAPTGRLREAFRSFGPVERFLVLLPAVVAAGYAAAAVPESAPAAVALRVGVVFLVGSLVVLSLTAAVALARS
jgi:uncharacterized membrane protein YgdD (TMEM256/DUF423 family)